MSRIKMIALALLLIVVVIAVAPAMAAAPSPATCLPSCWASNYGSPDGTGVQDRRLMWLYTDADAVSLRTLVRDAVKGKLPLGNLTVYKCANAGTTSCPAVQFTFTFGGEEKATQLGDLPVPVSGVPVPTPYLLLGGVALAVLLLAAGLALRFRARQLRA